MSALADRIKIGISYVKTFGKKRPQNYQDGQNMFLTNRKEHKKFVKTMLFGLRGRV